MTFELGHLPERGEEATIDNFYFKIVSANSRRINNMQVSLLSENKVKHDLAENVDSDVDKSIEENASTTSNSE